MARKSTPQQQQEILKCGRDPIYFIKKYVFIQHPTKGTLQFKTFPYQDDCINAFQEHRFNIVLKSRQLGLSTLAAAYSIWMAIFRKDKNILVIATKLKVETRSCLSAKPARRHMVKSLGAVHQAS